jgi:hypothetical protein
MRRIGCETSVSLSTAFALELARDGVLQPRSQPNPESSVDEAFAWDRNCDRGTSVISAIGVPDLYNDKTHRVCAVVLMTTLRPSATGYRNNNNKQTNNNNNSSKSLLLI